MKKINFDVVKICAVGCYKTFITINYKGHEVTFYTGCRGLYDELKKDGVPTSQSLRKKGVKKC